MRVYTIKFIDSGENAYAVVDVESSDDASVIKEVEQADVLPRTLGFDIREGERLVLKYRR